MLPIVIELAAVAALAAYFLGRVCGRKPMVTTDRVPFGLFLAPAIWVCWLLNAVWLVPHRNPAKHKIAGIHLSIKCINQTQV